MTLLNEEARKKKIVPNRTRQILLVFSVVNLLLLVFIIFRNSQPTSLASHINGAQDSESYKKVALKLESNSVSLESAKWFERYLNSSQLSAADRATLAFQIGQIYFEKAQYEIALGWFYLSETHDPHPTYQKELSQKIISTLENLKRFSFAKYELDKRSGMDNTAPAGTSPDAKQVVAKIGDETITNQDIEKALSKLPKDIVKQLSDNTKRQQFIVQLVAERVLFRRAMRQGMTSNPEIREQIDDFTQRLLVSQILQQHLAKLKPTPMDLQTFYQAHKEKFENKPFAEVQNKVAQAYSQAKIGEVYQTLLQEAMVTEKIQLFPEKVEFKGLK